jgi:hypothetical protein
LELLAGELVRLIDPAMVSRETIRRRLAENELKPWQRKMWCIPKVDAEFVARMEDVLDLYAESPNRKRPVICFDETPTQLIGEARTPIPHARPRRCSLTPKPSASAWFSLPHGKGPATALELASVGRSPSRKLARR